MNTRLTPRHEVTKEKAFKTIFNMDESSFVYTTEDLNADARDAEKAFFSKERRNAGKYETDENALKTVENQFELSEK